ncbi:hypothetical protein ACO0LV_01885 [Pseudactinotalea sp. Z1739]|uniref:hypothetical protein n=1 Tax=Pseudactinotalea sp. Z1739 TaxID=3413028 RepID=UPI003C7AA4F4
MKRRGLLLAPTLAVAVLVAGCGASAAEEAAQAVYEECVRPDADHQLLEHDGPEVRIAVTGDAARARAGASGALDAVERGDDPEDVDFTGMGIAMGVVLATECLVEETRYPGSSDQLQDGDEWEGWRFTEESGAGSEFTATFTSTG